MEGIAKTESVQPVPDGDLGGVFARLMLQRAWLDFEPNRKGCGLCPGHRLNNAHSAVFRGEQPTPYKPARLVQSILPLTVQLIGFTAKWINF